MTTKFKILSAISFIALAVVLTFVGVWAVADLNFTVGGDITYTAPQSSVDLKWDDEGNYWYVTMGHTDTISEIKWRLVGVDGTRYTSSTKPISGTGTFILETYIDITSKFNASNSDGNDYAISLIRTYLKDDYVIALNLANDEIYNAIAPCSMTSLYTEIGWATGNIGGSESYAPPADTTQYALYTISTTNAESDKLWLMSVKEIYTLVGGGDLGTDNTIPSSWDNAVKNNLIWNGKQYWLRSPTPSYYDGVFGVNAKGNSYQPYVYFSYAVRPAFNLNF